MQISKIFLIELVVIAVVAVAPMVPAASITEWTHELDQRVSATKFPTGPTAVAPDDPPPDQAGPLTNHFLAKIEHPVVQVDARSFLIATEKNNSNPGTGSVSLRSQLGTAVFLGGQGQGLLTALAQSGFTSRILIDLDQPVRVCGRLGAVATRQRHNLSDPVVGTWSGLARLDLINLDDGSGNPGGNLTLAELPVLDLPGRPTDEKPTEAPPFDLQVNALAKGEIVYQAEPQVTFRDLDSIPDTWHPAEAPAIDLSIELTLNVFDVNLGGSPTNPLPPVIDLLNLDLPKPQQPSSGQAEASFLSAQQQVPQFPFFPTDLWYEVPDAATFGDRFEMLSDDLFETIEGVSGFDGLVRVFVGDQEVAALGEGEGVDFVAMLGGGVKSFSLVPDVAGPATPAVHLTFDNVNARFAVLPEPTTVILLSLAGWVGLHRRSAASSLRSAHRRS